MFEERGAVRHRVYSEMLSWEELDKPRTRELLVRYGLELVLAVRPWDVPALPRVSRALRDIEQASARQSCAIVDAKID